MSTTEQTYYRMKRMHRAFVAAGLALLATTVWMLVADGRRPWKDYQRQYSLLRGDKPHYPAIEQIWLPDLTVDYNFRRVARADRCTTCHQGIDRHGDCPNFRGHGHRPKVGREAVVDENGTVPFVLPQPFAAHPRPDLFLGLKSPHPLPKFGCTICHDGQGTATDFRWASHAPNDLEQAERWRNEFGWSANGHWNYPMLPRRFQESRCLACHRSVVDLAPSRRFPDPPAAKLVEGYQLVRQYGCFACHEISVFSDVDHKPGPSLRNIADKLDVAYIDRRLHNPASVLPTTRMPRLFGLDEHLEGDVLARARQEEETEIRAITAYLLAMSEKVQKQASGQELDSTAARFRRKMDQTPSLAQPPSAQRGKRLFETLGCLACHRHRDFPQAVATQGPDLSEVGAKYARQSGIAWLTGWLRDPARYSPQTLMPNPLMETSTPIAEGETADPAADVAVYLLGDVGSATGDGRPSNGDLSGKKTFPAPRPLSPASIALGRQVIAKRGCARCHDIPGFESAERIGPDLSNWGRKAVSLLAFERINEFVSARTSSSSAADDSFYRDALLAHRREGFIWQKLRMPRSFDYRVAKSKPIGDQLKMGRFELTESQREAIITFILALVDDAPAAKYAYQPDLRQKAIIEGRKVLDKYACAECHTLEFERWTLDGKTDLFGVPRLDTSGALQQDEDDEGNPLYFFTLWEPATIDGQVHPVGGADVVVPRSRLTRVRPPVGGTLARLLYPVVLHDARESGSSAAEVEAWGWLPPSLVHEGALVQPQWLFQYLLEPTVIRPAAVLRMPRFGLSRDEAAKLTDYFAATAGAEYPYTAKPTAQSDPLPMKQLDKAMRLVRDSETYCAKCHLIDEYHPAASNRTLLAPRLDDVAARIRPEYVRRWLAEPKSVLPYTAMPAHFPASGEPLGQELLPGSSREQLDAVAELLLRYDDYMRHRTPTPAP